MLYAVKNVALAVPFELAHSYIADPLNLPVWTNALTDASSDGTARLSTPKEKVE